MTSQSPRIYLYKITFEEVLYYYYGVHKEKIYNEYYMGTPVTHKWCWELYTPKKQILEIFPFTDDGWIEALEVEKRLIRPFFNDDKWCLNENLGGVPSLECCRKGGKIMGKITGNKNKENKTGICALTTQDRIEIGRKSGTKNYINGIGIASLTKEQLRENGKKLYTDRKGIHAQTPEQYQELGKNTYEKGLGCFSLTTEQRKEANKKSDETNRKNGTGIYGMSIEKMKETGKKFSEKMNSQRWECTETGYISTPAGLSSYQKARGIDTSKRIRIL
jgi:hypothetical protein